MTLARIAIVRAQAVSGRAAASGGESEDDPTLRILGHHGRLLERVLLPLREHTGDVEAARLGLYVALGSVDTEPEELAPAVLASRDENGRFDLERFFRGGFRQIHPLWPLTTLNNVSMGQLAIDLDVKGDSLVLTSDTDAGVRTLLEAQDALREGTVDRALVGGVSERVSAASEARGRLRGREGGVIEQAGALLLAREADAPASTLFLRGGATAFGKDARRRAVEEACRRAGLDPAQIERDEPDVRAGAAAAVGAIAAGEPRTRAVVVQGAEGGAGCVIVEGRER